MTETLEFEPVWDEPGVDPLAAKAIKTLVEAYVMLDPSQMELRIALTQLITAEAKFQLQLQQETVTKHNEIKQKEKCKSNPVKRIK